MPFVGGEPLGGNLPRQKIKAGRNRPGALDVIAGAAGTRMNERMGGEEITTPVQSRGL
jgi:hypothetical protein